MSLYVIDSKAANDIAVGFLQQYHSVVKIIKSSLEDGIWTVEVLVSSSSFKKFHVKVNAKTGQVIGF
ncbi:MAG TPA: hypothetical protein VJ792_08380 [Candidatus Nitrosotalea sp.]|nr:hypothetical protein [Candidatus Nitrosotalea sp.]